MSTMDQDLYVAATTGDFIVELKEKLDQVSKGEHTVLHLAAMHNNYQAVRFILQEKHDLLLKMNSRGETALHVAARKGYYLVVKLLIDKSKLDNSIEEFIRKANVDGDTALHLAAQKNLGNVVEEIVKADPDDRHSQNSMSETPLYMAASRGYNDVIHIILSNCTYTSVDGPDGKTILHAAVIGGHADCVILILEMDGELVNRIDNKGWTPLHYAAFHNCASLLEFIIPTRSTYRRMDNPITKTTPLHIAASEGHVSVVIKLMRILEDLNSDYMVAAVDEDGQNILHIAADKNHREVAKCILEYCPCIDDLLNKRDKDGNTPLHLLAMGGSFIPELIQHRYVDKKLRNDNNVTPFELLYTDKDIVADQFQIREALIKDAKKNEGVKINIQSEINVQERLVPNFKLKEKKFNRAKKSFKRANVRRMKEEVELYRERTSTQIIVTALITTVSFTVGFTLPGGYQQDGKPDQGLAVLSKETAFDIFMISDAIALLLSVSSLFLYFMSSFFLEVNYVSVLTVVSTVLNIVSVVAMVVTFMAGTYVVLPHSHSSSLGLVVCTICGIIFFLCVFVLLIIWICYIYKKKKLKD